MGSVEIAKKMIDKAVEAGADAVKFQTFQTDALVTKSAPKAEYQKKFGSKSKSQFEMLRKLQLNEDAHRKLMAYCKAKKITFLSSPFDLESIDLLSDLGIETFKIPSGEITNLPFLRKIGYLKKKVIMSTGMSDLGEIRAALDVLMKAGTVKENIIVLHCNTDYPTPTEDVNLRAMIAIKETFDVKVGYSDHTTGIEIPIAAAALGAEVIEKHFTLDRNAVGPDHKASLEPDEFKMMVRSIRNIKKALGNGIKKPSASEIKNRPIIRKSIVAARDIEQGEVFSEENITTKRPGAGISPMEWDKIIGKKAARNFKKDDLILL